MVKRLLASLIAVFAAFLGLAMSTRASASAASPAANLTIHSFTPLGSFSASQTAECLSTLADRVPKCDTYQVTVTNTGSRPVEAPVEVTDMLPAGLTLQSVQFLWSTTFNEDHFSLCKPQAVPVKCTAPIELAPDATLEMILNVTVDPGAKSGQTNRATASGGGSPDASLETSDVIGSSLPLFGPNALVSYAAGLDGAPDLQAGSHPYGYSTRVDLNSVIRATAEGAVQPTSVQDVKDVVVDLPLGFLGSAVATPRCKLAQLVSIAGCPANTQVGHIVTEPESGASANGPIYNVVPEHGAVAEFGFRDVLENAHMIYASVAPTPNGYVARATARDVTQLALTDVTTNFFGDPATRDGSSEPPVAMFTNPSDCSGKPLVTSVHIDSWQSPGRFGATGNPDLSDPNWASASTETPPVSGCNQLRFSAAAFSVQPETSTADTPTGLNFDLKVPQTETPGTLATPPLRNATVTLPPGLTVDPSAASGLQACSEAQVGMSASGVPNAAPPTCPDASKIGSVAVTSPLIETTLQGSVYLATQDENPFHSLLAGYIVIDDPTTGTIVKIPGELKTDPVTGQITGVFKENPQIPFSELKIHFFGGPRGDLATPEGCGTYTTTSDLSPWSAPDSGPDATPSDSFQINSGCVSGFAPAFTAGTTNPQAGAYSPFTLSFSRQDSEEAPAGLTASLPTGLLGKIAGVAECSDAAVAAAAGNSGAAENASPSCPAASQLGTVQTATGPGPNPFVVPGKAYLTGPYKGAPYGVAVIVPAVAGPFDLGTVVIRQALYIDPNDAHATDVSDPFPTILKGIPLRIKRVTVTLDRPEFIFNPTSCEPKTVNATVTSIGGAPAPVSSHFQAAGCASLPFHPEFSASTDGKTSKRNGASLHVKIGFPTGGQANIHKVELEIPKVLPSRLTTLQKACTEAQFNTNPAGCPSASNIAIAVAHTPLLPDPLVGPVYFVSHGGAAFPDTEIILQGDGVTLLVDGKTDIKHGITYSRFQTVPDAPVTSFEFKAPEGPYSIFAAFGNLCQTELRMPTTITAQNGAVFKQHTVVEAEHCPKVKAKKVTKRHKAKKGHKAKGSAKRGRSVS